MFVKQLRGSFALRAYLLLQGPVFSVLCRDGYLYSGGRDGILHCWRLNENMESAGFLQV